MALPDYFASITGKAPILFTRSLEGCHFFGHLRDPDRCGIWSLTRWKAKQENGIGALSRYRFLILDCLIFYQIPSEHILKGFDHLIHHFIQIHFLSQQLFHGGDSILLYAAGNNHVEITKIRIYV